MALNYNLIPLRDLARGLDLRAAESNVADGFAEALDNVVTNSSGHLAKRVGYQGAAGYLPLRVSEVTHDGYQINFKLANSVDLTGVPSSPIILYGKFDQAESGDFSTTNAAVYYSGFSVDTREIFTSAGNTVTKTSSDHGFSNDNLMVFTMSSTSDTDQDNTAFTPDSVTVTTAGTVAVTATSASADRAYIAILDKSTVSGTSYVADYSGAALTPSGGTVSGTISAATHGLSNFNFIAKFYTLSGSTYTEFIPDTCTYDDTTGDVSFSFLSGSNFDGQVVLDVPGADNYAQLNVGAGSSASFVVSDIDTSFPYWTVWRLNGSTWEMVLPDSASVDDSANTLTVTVSNASTSTEVYELYYDFATIQANTIRVVDSSATSTTYTGTTITDPQLTLWGVSHSDRYLSTSTRGGHVLHLDAYKREAEARLVAGLGGNLYAARTRSEVGSTYQLPSLSVDLDARVGSNVSLAPLFQVTGTSSSIRTRGIITGDDVSAGYAVVTGASYVSSGVVDYTISLTSKSGTLALNTQVAATDYLTVSGLAHSVLNGTFRITAVTDGVSSVTIRVANSSVTTTDYDETGADGRANVFTDNLTTSASTNYIAGDVLTADSIDSDLTLTVKSVSGTTVTVSGVTDTVTLAAGTSIFGTRTSYIHPLRNSASTASVAYLTRGDMVTLSNYQGDTLERLPRVTYVHPFQDMSVAVTVASGTATVSLGGSKTVNSVGTLTDVFTTSTSHGFTTKDPILFSTTGSLPAGLRTDTVYFVEVTGATTFNIHPTETGSTIDLTTTGSGTITAARAHNLSAGQRFTLAQTGDATLDAVGVVVSVPDRNSFTFTTSASDGSYTGVLVGRTAEFDESLTFSDALTSPTVATVGERWVPIEAPTFTGTKPRATYVSYFDDVATTLRSVIVAGNMYFTNYTDEVHKFDGTSLYQAGLFRWQPQLFAQVDTGTSSLVLDGSSAAGTANCQNGNVFTLSTASDAGQFRAGDRIIHSSADDAVYTVQYSDSTLGKVYVTSPISSSDTSWAIKKVKTYRYYFRLNAIDANNNVVASAATGAQDVVVELTTAGQIRLRLVGLPTWGVYDYDRLELQVYRTVADTPNTYYRIRSVPVTFSTGYGYIDVFDGTTDDVLEAAGSKNWDSTMVALAGGELGTAWEQPPRAKYITTVNNRLVLANIKDYQQLDVVLRKQAGAASVATSDLTGQTFLFRKDSTDTSTTTNMVNRAKYEFVTSGAVTINPAADIARDSTTFTVTEAGHGLVAGNWVYLFHAAAGADNDLHFAGWWQIASADTDTFTIAFANSYSPGAADVDRYVAASTKTDIPVWLGTDGNYNTKYGNTSGSYEQLAAQRLAAAINSTMVVTDTAVSGQSAFAPWLTAAAGGEYSLGQVVVRQPKYSSTTMEVLLGTIGSNYDIYVNNVKRASADQVSATSLLYPSRVVVSYENHPEIFDNPLAAQSEDSDSLVDVNSADGQEITGVVPFFGESSFGQSQVESTVVVFKTNSIYVLDVKTRQVQKIDSQGLGCTAPYSIAPTRNGIMFANLSGVYRLNRNLTISYVGRQIERYWRDTVNAEQLALATAHNYGIGRQYRLSVPVDSDTTNSVVLVYDHTREGQEQEFGAWTKFTNFPATGWANLDDDAYFATTSGQVFKIRTANDASDFRDDAAAVDQMVILLKAMDCGLPGARKSCRNAVVHMRMDKTSVTGTTIYSAVDLDETFTSAGTVNATLGTKKVETFRVALPVPRFTYVQLKMTNSTKDEEFVLAGVDLMVAALSGKGVPERAELD